MNQSEKDSLKLRKIYLKFCVIAPFLLLLLIIIFIYTIFQSCYIIPLLTNNHWYQNNSDYNVKNQDEFPFFKMIMKLEEKLLKVLTNFQKDDPDNNSDFIKGLFYCLIEHYLLFWFFFSLIRTMKTDPGGIPTPDSPWGLKIRAIYINIKKNEQNIQFKLKKAREKEERKTNKNEPIKVSEILYLSEEMANNQGRQGTNSISSNSQEEFMEYDSDLSIFNEQEKTVINIRTLEQVRKKENLRFCQHCRCFKPLRTHHCQQCMRCIRKMDHHCQWLLNCVGFRNYKFFMNMLFYGDLVLFFIIITFTKCVFDVALNPLIDGFFIYTLLLAYVLSVVLFGLLFGFTFFHLWLIFTAKTSLEYCEKWSKKENKEKNKLINFDEGYYKNFVNVFNTNPLFWFFPFRINTAGEGLFEEFEKQDSGEL